MKQSDLQFADILGYVPDRPQSAEDAKRLWSRIADEHLTRKRRRLRRRIGFATVLTTCAVVGVFVGLQRFPAHAQIDWQARAQALELQLDALGSNTSALLPVGSDADLHYSLNRVDRALQAAYDRHASNAELSSLWKRRSELLNTLLVARRGHLVRI